MTDEAASMGSGDFGILAEGQQAAPTPYQERTPVNTHSHTLSRARPLDGRPLAEMPELPKPSGGQGCGVEAVGSADPFAAEDALLLAYHLTCVGALLASSPPVPPRGAKRGYSHRAPRRKRITLRLTSAEHSALMTVTAKTGGTVADVFDPIISELVRVLEASRSTPETTGRSGE